MSNIFISEKETDILDKDELKELLIKGLKNKTKSKKVLEWFDFEFHTIYEAGKFNGIEIIYHSLGGNKRNEK